MYIDRKDMLSTSFLGFDDFRKHRIKLQKYISTKYFLKSSNKIISFLLGKKFMNYLVHLKVSQKYKKVVGTIWVK